MKRTQYKNQFNKDNYDQIHLVLKKGQKDSLKNWCKEKDISVNEYIKTLIQEDIVSGQSKLLQKLNGFSLEDRKILDKWQVAEKYRPMIQDFYYDKKEGYFIRLKPGFINTVTGSRIIICEKMQEVRKIINKSVENFR